MRKLFTVLFLFVLICAVSFAQTKQVEYYINGIDLGKGEILKFGTDKDNVVAIVKKKMLKKNMFHQRLLTDAIAFDNVVINDGVDIVKYDTVICSFDDNKLYLIKLKRLIDGNYIRENYPNMYYNPEVQRTLIKDKYFVMEQIYRDTKSKKQ